MAVARLSFTEPDGVLRFEPIGVDETAPLLAAEHYLGPARSGSFAIAGWLDDELVAAMVYRPPTARLLPADGTWIELSRWCLTPAAGKNAGSRMMGFARRYLRRTLHTVRTIVSYSDPSQGHTGALYRASGWTYAPTHHSLRFALDGTGYPSGHGTWDGATVQAPKDRWLYALRRDPQRAAIANGTPIHPALRELADQHLTKEGR